MKTRNLEYEKKFRAYLFGFDLETHKKICENINVKPNFSEDKPKKELINEGFTDADFKELEDRGVL